VTRSEARNVKRARPVARPPRGYRDLHEHLDALREQGLLLTIDRVIDKDAELHPLVRWQFVGGLDEADRKAFLFTNVIDGRGRAYDMPVVVGAIAAKAGLFAKLLVLLIAFKKAIVIGVVAVGAALRKFFTRAKS